MDNLNNQEDRFNLEEFSKKSEDFYNRVKAELELKFKGKYVALDFESEKYWIGETATEALGEAKKEFQDRLFYLLQIGSATPFTIQSVKIFPHPRPKYDFARQY